MSFTTLEARFNATADTLYKRYDNPEQLNAILPNSAASRSSIKNDSRELPAVSTERDLKVMGNYLTSVARGGPRFLAKQLLLQTGNTFAETRLYNPLGVLIHTVPFVHLPRNIGKLPNLLGSIQVNRGALQSETIKKFTQSQSGLVGRLLRGATNAITSPFRAIVTSPKRGVEGFYERPEDVILAKLELPLFEVQPLEQRGKLKSYSSGIINLVSNPSRQQSIPNAQHRGVVTPKVAGAGTRASTGVRTTNTATTKTLYHAGNTYLSDMQPKDSAGKFVTTSIATGSYFTQTVNAPDGESRTFRSLIVEPKNLNGYFSGSNRIPAGGPVASTTSGSTNLRDPYNISTTAAVKNIMREARTPETLSYAKISGEKDDKTDIVKFIFTAVNNTTPVHFRALISTIKQNVKPEYNEARYIGRTERFVTYAGAKRSVTLEFNVVAFSAEELDQMWTRINYLTGMAFPAGVSPSGFMIPPLFKVTIGGIFDGQPCYVDSLDFTMLDETITFDIDKEVSQVIAVNMTLTLLEKRSGFYDTPFYGIAESIQKSQSATAELNSTPYSLPTPS
jgi:hypothetical protein